MSGNRKNRRAERSRADLRRLSSALPELERRFVVLRFGLDGEPSSLDAIRRELGLTAEGVRRLEREVLERLEAAPPEWDGHRIVMHGVGVDPDGLPLSCLVVHWPSGGKYVEQHEFFVVERGPGAYARSMEGPGRTLDRIVADYRDDYELVWIDLRD